MDNRRVHGMSLLMEFFMLRPLGSQYLEISREVRNTVKAILNANFNKSKLMTLVGLLFIFSNVSANNDSQVVWCHATSTKLPGSYIGQRSTPEFTSNRIDQLQLHSDGSAYWNQSYAINFPLSDGTYTPAIGSWKCLGDGTLAVTVIRAISTPYPNATNPTDLEATSYSRFTFNYRVLHNGQLEVFHRVDWNVPFNEDVLLPHSGTVSQNDSTVYKWKKVRVTPSDLNP